MRGLRVPSFPGQNTLQPPQKQRHLVHRNTDDVRLDWHSHKVFFRTGGDIGARGAYHARLSGKPSPISTRRRPFSMPPCVRDLPLAELRSVKGNDVVSEDRALPGRPIDDDRLSPAQASTVLTKGAGFVFGDLGFFQNEIDLSLSDKGKPRGFADIGHGCTRDPLAALWSAPDGFRPRDWLASTRLGMRGTSGAS